MIQPRRVVVVFSTLGDSASITDAEPDQTQPARRKNQAARPRVG